MTRSVVFSELDDSMHFLRHLRFCCLQWEATGGARYQGACVRVWRARSHAWLHVLVWPALGNWGVSIPYLSFRTMALCTCSLPG